MSVNIADGSKDVEEPFASIEVIDCNPTTISREMSGASEKGTLLGMNRDESYPPSVRLPKTPFNPGKC